MKFTNLFVVLTSQAVALLAIHIGGARSMNYDFITTSLGFKDITINGTEFKDVEFIWSHITGFGRCSNEFVLASQSILTFIPKEIKDRRCRIGVRHEANLSEPLLTVEEARNFTFVIERIKKLDFYWHLDGKRFEQTNIDDVDEWIYARKDTRILQRAYNTILINGRIVVVPDDAPMTFACCMRNPFLPASRRVPSYPEFPASGIGRHDVTINGHLYKNVPYVATTESFCPYGMQDAIVTVKEFPGICLVSVAFIGSPTLLHGEDPNDIKVKRSRFQWIIDGKPAGNIPDELWRDHEPSPSFESLQKATIWINRAGLFVHNQSYHRCCMELTKEETTSATTDEH